jgi:hypothetical protein
MGACIVRYESISVGALFNGTQNLARLRSMSRKSELSSLDLADKSDVAIWCRHGKNNPLEGEDFFYDFRTRRFGRNSLLAMEK